MGYEFFCGFPIAVVVVLALVMGASITLSQIEDQLQSKQSRLGPPNIGRETRPQNNSLDASPFRADNSNHTTP